jgi:MSHA pilin protein MshD
MGDASVQLIRNNGSRYRSQLGATLIELIVSIVIVSVSVTGIMMVISNTTRASADPMLRTQATAIAEAYLEEILSQALNDPDTTETGGAEAGETRANFDDVSDYHGLADTGGAIDQSGNPIAGLERYNVSVDVSVSSVNGEASKRIQVSVGHDAVPGLNVAIAVHRVN